MQNQTTGGSQQYGYSLSEAAPADGSRPDQRQQRAVHARHDDDRLHPARSRRRRPVLGNDDQQQAGRGQHADLFSFHFDQAELNSTATGSVLLRVLVQGTSGGLVPATPTIAGLTPLSVNTRGDHRGRAVPDRPAGALCRLGIGRHGGDDRQYSLNLTVAGDINGDGNVDGNDSTLLAAALGSHRRIGELQPGRRYQRRRHGEPGRRGDPRQRLRVPRDDGRGAHHAPDDTGLQS